MEVEHIFNKFNIYNSKNNVEKESLKNAISEFIAADDIKIRKPRSFIQDQKTSKVIQTLFNAGFFTNVNYEIFRFPKNKLDVEEDDESYDVSRRVLFHEIIRMENLIPVRDENINEVRKFLAEIGYSDELINTDDFNTLNDTLISIINEVTHDVPTRKELKDITPISYFSKLLVDEDITFEVLDENSLRNEHKLIQLLENDDTYMYASVRNGLSLMNGRRAFNNRLKLMTVVKINNKVLELNKLNNGVYPKNSVLAFHGTAGENYFSLIRNGFLTRGDIGITAAGQLFGINAVYFGTDLPKLIWGDNYSSSTEYFNLDIDSRSFVYGNINKFNDIETYANKRDIRNYNASITSSYSEEISNRVIEYNLYDSIYVDKSNNDYNYLFIIPNPREPRTQDKYLFISGRSSIYTNSTDGDPHNGIISVRIKKASRLSGGARGNNIESLTNKYVFELVAEVDVGTPLVVNTRDPGNVLTKENVERIGCNSIIAPRYKIYPDERCESYVYNGTELIPGGDTSTFNNSHRNNFMGIKTSFPLRYIRDRQNRLVDIQNSSSQSISIFNSNQAVPKYLLIYKRNE